MVTVLAALSVSPEAAEVVEPQAVRDRAAMLSKAAARSFMEAMVSFVSGQPSRLLEQVI